MKKYKPLIFLFFHLYFIFAIFPAQLKQKQLITPKEPFCISKIIVYQNNLFVLDSDNHRVVLIDRKGNILQTFGGRGEGPGEHKFLTDFGICGNQIITCGGKRINLFTLKGEFIRLIKTRNSVLNIATSGKEWFYVALETTISKARKTIERFFIFNDSTHASLLKIPDETQQRAYHPLRGNNVPFPWFPSPFCNRPIFLDKNDNDPGSKGIAIFMTRQKEFRLLENGRLETLKIDAALKQESVTQQDKDEFFEKIIPAPTQKTKQSVIFPEDKEFFSSAINWGTGWALVTGDSFIILDKKGNYLQTVNFTKELRMAIKEGYPFGTLYMREKELFCIKENENLLVFSIISADDKI